MAKYPDQRRNLNPHAEAVLAMTIWGREYAAQNGGSMDFWDSLDDSRKRICADLLKRTRELRGWDGGHCGKR